MDVPGMLKPRWLLALAAATALFLGLGVAAARADASASPAPSSSSGASVLRVGWESNIDSLNPFVGQATEAYTVYHLNYDFLVRYDAATLEPIPGLAESWSHSADGKTWTFKLRHDVTWQDGEPFTAKDVVFTFNYVIENDVGSYTGYTKGITKVVGHGRLHRRLHLRQAQGDHAADVGPDPARAHLVARSRPKTPPTSSRTSRRSSVPDPSRWSTGSPACSCA